MTNEITVTRIFVIMESNVTSSNDTAKYEYNNIKIPLHNLAF